MAGLDAWVQQHDYPCWCGERRARHVCHQMFGRRPFAVLACLACQTHRILPRALSDQAAAAQLYNQYELGAVDDPTEQQTARRMLRRVQEVNLPLGPRCRVLDVGCGAGAILEAICQHYGCRGKGIDVDARRIERARRVRAHAEFECGLFDARHIDQPYDVVLCTAVIEHVVTPVDFMRSLAAALKPAGSLFVLTPNAACWTYRVLGSWWRDLLSVGEHIYLFTPQSLEACARRAGLRLVAMATDVDHAPFRLTLRPPKQLLVSLWWLYRETVRRLCTLAAPPLGRDILYAHFKRAQPEPVVAS